MRYVHRALSPALVLIVLVAGCGSNHPTANGLTATATRTVQAQPSASAAASPAQSSPSFRASVSVLTAVMRTRMTGVSWRQGCPVGLDQLRLLTLDYWGVYHAVHQGRLIANATAATSLTRAFKLLFEARFPIAQMRPIDEFAGSDEASMRADNTSAFNCAKVPGTTVWSQHSYGLAVDLDPLENPEVRDGIVDPPTAAGFVDRTQSNPLMIAHGDAAWRAFDAVGWSWGGDWRSLKDYQHFSENGY